MDRIWDDFLSSWDTNPIMHDFQNGPFAGPCVDIYESGKEYRFEIELPGLTQREVKILVGNNILTIKGQKTPDSQSSDSRALHLERSYGAFERSFSLPIDVCEDKIDAAFDSGILVVRLRKNPLFRRATNQVKIKSSQDPFNGLWRPQENQHGTKTPKIVF
jgi:HSP20 family protein